MKIRFWAAGLVLLGCLSLHGSLACGAEADPFWAYDKKLHFGVSASLAGTTYLGASFLTPTEYVRATTAEMLAFSAGIAKEVYDKLNHGDPSFRDLTWDLIGSTTGTVVAWLFDRYLF